jgi:hypothetical protein
MKRFGHFDRIENMVGVGMPDVTYCIGSVEGFIENKWRLRWPARAETPVTLDHFTPQQRIWIQQRCNAGGRVWVLLEIEQPEPTYLLLRGEWAWRYLGRVPRAEIERAAVLLRAGSFPAGELAAALSG